MKVIKILKSLALMLILSLTLTSCMKKELTAEPGDKVLIHYVGTFENGEEFDNSYDIGSPIEFTIGDGQMISGFNTSVQGMKVGDKKTVTLTPAEAYGERDETLVEIVEKTQLTDFEEAGIPLEKGSILPTGLGNFEIVDSDEETVTVDMNHQMAGKTLIFEMEMVEIVRE